MNITVYCASTSGDSPLFMDAAARLGARIGKAGHRIVYGGSESGTMGALANAALSAGGEVHGVELKLFAERGLAHEGLTILEVVDSMAKRKVRMRQVADVFVALPGGPGTLEELSEVLSDIKLGLADERLILLNQDGFYEPLRQLLFSMCEHGFMDRDMLRNVVFEDDVEGVCRALGIE